MKMPLDTTGKLTFDRDPINKEKAIGFLMMIRGVNPPKQIQIFVTIRCLEALNGSVLLEGDEFQTHRVAIEAAASKKFDVENERYKDRTTLTVDSCDLD
jgi:hypothetical protein